jgi:hypothetical protein
MNSLLGDSPRAEASCPISSSLSEWLNTLESCVVSFSLRDVTLPLTRNCFFAGTTHAVLLLKRGHCDQLVRDIAGFSDEESPLVPLRAVYLAIWRAYQRKRDVCIDPEPLLQPLAMVVPEECQRAKDAETNLGNLCKSPLQ